MRKPLGPNSIGSKDRNSREQWTLVGMCPDPCLWFLSAFFQEIVLVLSAHIPHLPRFFSSKVFGLECCLPPSAAPPAASPLSALSLSSQVKSIDIPRFGPHRSHVYGFKCIYQNHTLCGAYVHNHFHSPRAKSIQPTSFHT